jgi:hypothetical protein
VRHSYSRFHENYIVPSAAAAWSSRPAEMLQFAAHFRSSSLPRAGLQHRILMLLEDCRNLSRYSLR